MAKVLNRTLILALVTAFGAAVPAVAVESPTERTPSSAEPPLRVAPFGSERTRLAQPGRRNGLLPPDVWVYELQFFGVVPDAATVVPYPVELHIPRGYSRVLPHTGSHSSVLRVQRKSYGVLPVIQTLHVRQDGMQR